MNNDWVYDIEFYKNFFVVNLLKYPCRGEKKTFEISERRDQRQELLEFLSHPDLRLIGFNNVNYDYPVLHVLIEQPKITVYEWWKHIQRQLFGDDRWVIWDSDRHVYQIDLFRINHYDNKARITSLKWLEFTQRWHKVQDLPINPQVEVTHEQMDELTEYCWNDVEFTFEFARSCQNAIEFRERMSTKLGRNLMDFSDVKIGEHLNQIRYQDATGKTWKDIKGGATFRKNYPMYRIIPDSVEFQTEFMKDFLKKLRGKVFDSEDSMIYNIILNNYTGEFVGIHREVMGQKEIEKNHHSLNTMITFAKGGLHTIDMPRVVKQNEGWVLMEKDVGSMYPRAIVVDKIYPEHLGPEWNESIKGMYDYRIEELKPKLKQLEYGSQAWKEVDDEQAVYKLAMNGGAFGKLGSKYSWQFDPLAKYKVTMGCELKLLMLIESFFVEGIEVVSVNTDGVVIHYPKERQGDVDRIHKEWEKKTDFLLEDTYYKQIVFSSVNDYLAEIIDPSTGKRLKIKYKGDFEIDKEPHKNNSQRIVAIALRDYFLNDGDIKSIIGDLNYKFENNGKEEQVSIYDYCIGRKATKTSDYVLVSGNRATVLTDKVIRYFISKEPNYLMKRYLGGNLEGRRQKVNAGFNISMFMDFYPPEMGWEGDYHIDTRYYVNECQKIIDPIEKGTRILNGGCYTQGVLFGS